MPRAHRTQGAGLTHHVMARGNNRRDIFEDDHDRFSFLGMVEETRRRRDWRIHAWCLMTNHVHLLVTTEEPDLSAGLRDVLGRYARRYNHFNERTGHLFGQRFRSILVTSDEQYLTTVRYINRNPVEAGLTDRPDHDAWSGYALRRSPYPPVTLDETMTLDMLHPVAAVAERQLRELIHSDRTPHRAAAPRPAIRTLLLTMGRRSGARAAAALGYERTEIARTLGITVRALDWTLHRT